MENLRLLEGAALASSLNVGIIIFEGRSFGGGGRGGRGGRGGSRGGYQGGGHPGAGCVSELEAR